MLVLHISYLNLLVLPVLDCDSLFLDYYYYYYCYYYYCYNHHHNLQNKVNLFQLQLFQYMSYFFFVLMNIEVMVVHVDLHHVFHELHAIFHDLFHDLFHHHLLLLVILMYLHEVYNLYI